MPDAGPLPAVQSAFQTPNELVRAASLLSVLSAVDATNIDEVVSAFEAQLFDLGDWGHELALLAEAWVSVAPDAPNKAFAHVSAWDRLDPAHHGLYAVTRAWARLDPADAADAVSRLDGSAQKRAEQGLIQGWGENGDSGIWEYVSKMGPDKLDREQASIQAMRAVFRSEGADRLFSQVAALPDRMHGKYKLHAFRSAGSLVARADPDSAMAFAERHAAGPYSKNLYARVAERVAETDGVRAMDWLRGLEAGKERDKATFEAHRRWRIENDQEASLWLEAQPQGAWLHPLFPMHAVGLAQSDAPGAIAWAQKISDPEVRDTSLVRVGLYWLQTEPEAARIGLAQIDLLERVETRLEQLDAKRGRSGAPRS